MAGTGESLVVLGRIVGLYGVLGWVKVHSDTQPRENILGYSPWRVQMGGQWQPMRLLGGRRQGKGVVAQLEGCTDRDRARELLGCPIAIERRQLPAPAEGETYWTDLVGMILVNRDGAELGRVVSLFETGANNVMVVEGERQLLVPFIDGVVLDVDHESGRLQVDWDQDF